MLITKGNKKITNRSMPFLNIGAGFDCETSQFDNHKKYNKKDNNNTKASRRVCEHEPEMFERFWRCYPRHEDKEKARREWDSLKADRELMNVMSAALDRAKSSEDWQRGIGIPYACRWLSHRRWEDTPDVDLADAAEAPERRLAGARC